MKTNIRGRYINITLHVLIWSTLLLLPYVVSTAANGYRIGPIPGTFFTIAGFIHMGIFYGNAYWLWPRLMNRQYWWLYVISALLLIIVSFQLKYRIMQAWYPVLMMDTANYRLVFAPSVVVFVISVVYRRVLDKIVAEREQKEKKAEALATELKFLRSQVSPHFLFNVLTNLVSLARKKSDQLEPALIMLSDLIRYMLYDSQVKKVSLDKEITYLENYIELQQLRFGNDVDIHTEMLLDDSAQQATIEPMLLIPFVENAFKHGTGYTERPFIRIALTLQQGTLTFDVQNGFDREQDKSKDDASGIGLANVKSRLQLLYKERHRLVITEDEHLFHVKLTLKLI
ncbi:sensor histidine kinase [Chitinophaga vietnamensis]|uniref:sensor histidine kinase n=1 Tax=Chitinophaga vietnamensis TaxID=2593957 RepID=UPI00117786F2|nr:histidine kinase [Chitinophaga vietnamensis]